MSDVMRVEQGNPEAELPVSDRMQGVDCPLCEEEIPHRHVIPLEAEPHDPDVEHMVHAGPAVG